MRTSIGEEAFKAWGWRIPFLVSILLLGVSLWIRLKLNESPVFQQMVDEGKTSKKPLTESFGNWPNLKLVMLALAGLTAGQAVVWYTGQFYALFFLEKMLKVDGALTNTLVAVALLLGTPFFVFFGWLSDKIGRKPIILAGCLLAALTYFPIFKALTAAANPAAGGGHGQRAGDGRSPTPPTAPSSSIRWARQTFTTSCDLAKSSLANAGVTYANAAPRRRARSPWCGSATVDGRRASDGEALPSGRVQGRRRPPGPRRWARR